MSVLAPRHYRDDEQPEPDEGDWDRRREAEIASGHCGRCGVHGHPDAKCPTVHLGLLKNIGGEQR